ncbi:MAG TPA: prolyl oligopeptidase family serine peptidase, partial [Thermoanaerobaculia bacterium]|nr:prolyl oligopeptidase family serine peptidase [Thermoanaerobaculia bacterium]
LAGLALGKVSPYHWQDKNGTPWAGLLALPPGHDPKRRYPLVIQTHGYRLDRYFVDGQFTTGSGGRALVAQGVVVLQMDMPSTHIFTPADAPFQLDGFQAAVARLAADGLIDPRRVGVIGFSFTCFYTLYALTHDPHLFAAAAITDGNEMSYIQYVFAEDGTAQKLAEDVNGGIPWGEGLASWTARSPDFHLDKVAAPLLISAFERYELLRQYEPYAALRRLGKPVELLWLRRENATHVLTRPLHRYLSQQSAVDWFDFWLNGHEDPAPAKAGQYARWRELRKLQTTDKP